MTIPSPETSTPETNAPDASAVETNAPEIDPCEASGAIRAKFVVETVTHYREPGAIVSLDPVYGEVGENKQFWQATPQGKIDMTITNPAAARLFTPEQAFYVDFTPVAS